MYIDKIYTKLYSDKDWNGLEQLVSEIRKFSRVSDNRLNKYIKTIDPDLRELAKEDYQNEVNKTTNTLKKYRPTNYMQYLLKSGMPIDEALDEYTRQKKAFYKDNYDKEGNPLSDSHEDALNKVKDKVTALQNMRNWKNIKITNYNKPKVELNPDDYDESGLGVKQSAILKLAKQYDEEGW